MIPLPAKIGPYTIEREIGRGGMGIVLLGRDPLLRRAVAIKGLTASTALDNDAVQRLVREAQMLAAIAHPNIITIFGVEDDGQNLYLVMEYIDGPDLSERLAAGPLPLHDALAVCAQAAAGLEAAHGQGVIHRDLKPGNIKLDAAGRVKVLDFGLARPASGPLIDEPLGHDSSVLPLPPMTRVGTVMGTPGYMSPEQVRGTALDRRSDIFSFGCVLFECLTGQRVFRGKTGADVMASVLTQEPDWALLPQTLPRRLRELLAASLQKSADDRLVDISSLRGELESVLAALRAANPMHAPGSNGVGGAPMYRRSMPRPETSFVGRRDELLRIEQLLEKTRILSIVGTAGSGKTRIALRLAAELRRSESMIPVYVEVQSNSDLHGLAREAAVVLMPGKKPGAQTMGAVIEAAQPSRPLLLILDDGDLQKQACIDAINGVLGASVQVRVLCLGRESPRVKGEVVHRLPPMDVPPIDAPASASDLAQFESVELFRQRAIAANDKFDLSLPVRGEVCRLVRRLGGAPLAIELAAAHLDEMPLSAIVKGVEDELRPLVAEGGGTISRQHIVWSVARWSMAQLGEQCRHGLVRLSAIAGGFSIDDAARVCADSADGAPVMRRDIEQLLGKLVSRGLVVRGPADGGVWSYGIHAAIKHVALKLASGSWRR